MAIVKNVGAFPSEVMASTFTGSRAHMPAKLYRAGFLQRISTSRLSGFFTGSKGAGLSAAKGGDGGLVHSFCSQVRQRSNKPPDGMGERWRWRKN